MKNSVVPFFIMLFIMIILLIGEIKCVIKMINCNFQPIGKAEIFYTVGTFTGAGCIIGYFNIEDK